MRSHHQDAIEKFAQYVKNSKKVYISGEGLPSELQIMYIGKQTPPFKHGDDL